MASRPGRSFTSILGIALGVATVLSVQIVDHNTILTEQSRRDQDRVAFDVELRPIRPGVPEEGALPMALAEDPGLADFTACLFQRIEVWAEDERKAATSPLSALGPGSSAFAAYDVDEGRDLRQPLDREVLLSARTAQELGVATGDTVQLRRATVTQARCIDGVVVSQQGPVAEQVGSFQVAGILADRGLGRGRQVIAPFEAVLPLFVDAHVQPVYWGRLSEGTVFQDVRERLKDAYLVEKRRADMIGERIDQRAFRKSLRVTSMLALLLGLFVIYHSFSMALVERVREIGLLRAMGLRRREIGTAVLAEGALLAVAGTLLGLFLTVGLVAFLVHFRVTTLGFGKPLEIRSIPWVTVALVSALAIASALLGMTAPLLRARHLSVVDAIRAGRLKLRTDVGASLRMGLLVAVPLVLPVLFVVATPPLGERQTPVFRLVLGIAAVLGVFFVALLVLPGRFQALAGGLVRLLGFRCHVEAPLAQAAIAGSRHRVMGTLTGLAIVVAVVFCVRGVNQSFLGEMREFSRVAMGQRTYLSFRQAKTREEVEQVARDLVPDARVQCMDAEVLTPFPLRGIAWDAVNARLPEYAQDPSFTEPFLAGERLILSRFLAESFGYQVGDEVALPTWEGPVQIRVGAITDDLGYFPDDRSFALLEEGRMESLFCVHGREGRRFVVDLAGDQGGNDPDGETVAAAFAAHWPEEVLSWSRSADRIAAAYQLDRRRDFFVFDFILWMVSCLACVGMWNSLTIAVLERRRELALLRTLGLLRRQVGLTLWLEAGALGILGGVLAAALAVPVTTLAIRAVRLISGLELTHSVALSTVLWPIGTGLLLALAAAVLPAWRSRRLDLAALARYE